MSEETTYTGIGSIERSEPELLKELRFIEQQDREENGDFYSSDSEYPNPPSRVQHITKVRRQYGGRSLDINWSEIRKHYVLGKRKQLEDGSWISEDYVYKELCDKFSINYQTLRNKISQENWHKLRKAYLARVNQINIGQELGIYTQENCQSEISALNACNKLAVVLDRYIENKFGKVLDRNEDIERDPGDKDPELHEYTVAELKEAVKVATDIYTLQRKVYDNAPKTDFEVIEKLVNRPRFKNEKDRLAKIKQLESKLGRSLLAAGINDDKYVQDY